MHRPEWRAPRSGWRWPRARGGRGTWRGWKECTLTCSDDAFCNPPEIAGVTTTFLECGADEDADRDICIPNEACFANPMSCMSLPGPF